MPAPFLYQHEDGRYGLSFGPARFAKGVPAWHRVPLDIVEPAPAESNNAVSSLLAAAHIVFGDNPWNVLLAIDAASQTLLWLETLFFVIRELNERGNEKIQVRHLADIGSYIAERAASNAEQSHDEIKASIEAAEAREES
ncbi:MAG: hypothetical protein LBF61_02095 [Azoarcus sp.]|nr:hypothetical protein [Azoarcus sp.]